VWQTKTFKTKEAMNSWLVKRFNKIEYQEIFINNGYGIQYRMLRRMR
jgi:hypothetical protein